MWGKQWLHKTVKKQPFKIVRHGHCTSGASCWCWNQGCLLCLPYVVCGKSSLCFKVLKCTGKTLLCLPYAVVSHHSSFVHVVFEAHWTSFRLTVTSTSTPTTGWYPKSARSQCPGWSFVAATGEKCKRRVLVVQRIYISMTDWKDGAMKDETNNLL